MPLLFMSSFSAPPVMTYAQLENLINKWSLELEDQERHFLQQATQVNAWDRMLIENGEKVKERGECSHLLMLHIKSNTLICYVESASSTNGIPYSSKTSAVTLHQWLYYNL